MQKAWPRRSSPAGERSLAEREGFEPSVEFPLHTLSKRAPSTTRTSLHFRINNLRAVWNSVAQNAPSHVAVPTCNLYSVVSDAPRFVTRRSVSDLLISPDHLQRSCRGG